MRLDVKNKDQNDYTQNHATQENYQKREKKSSRSLFQDLYRLFQLIDMP